MWDDLNLILLMVLHFFCIWCVLMLPLLWQHCNIYQTFAGTTFTVSHAWIQLLPLQIFLFSSWLYDLGPIISSSVIFRIKQNTFLTWITFCCTPAKLLQKETGRQSSNLDICFHVNPSNGSLGDGNLEFSISSLALCFKICLDDCLARA